MDKNTHLERVLAGIEIGENLVAARETGAISESYENERMVK